ncbi:hypothetical protein HYX00_00365, partial [Candidatus Woesearchaeota archaeon]|nr:hypothetical protein [Candidatus Woesearchaeota archaeon]
MDKLTTSIKVLKAELSEVKDNSLLVGFFKEKLSLSNELKKFDSQLSNLISSFIKDNNFKGEKGEVKSIYVNKNIKNIVLVGLGEENKLDFDIISTVIADVSKRLSGNETESFSIFLNSFNNGKFKEEEVFEKLVLSCLIGLYKFNEFKTKDREKIK